MSPRKRRRGKMTTTDTFEETEMLTLFGRPMWDLMLEEYTEAERVEAIEAARSQQITADLAQIEREKLQRVLRAAFGREPTREELGRALREWEG
jgi:hypothetical protein